MAGSTVPIAFALISFTFAYLAVNTPDKYASLQLSNYILTYLGIFFTGFISYSLTASGETPGELLTAWTNNFHWVLYLVVAIFLIRILNSLLEAVGKDVI